MSSQKKTHSPTENSSPSKKQRSSALADKDCPSATVAMAGAGEQTPPPSTTVSSIDMCYYCFDVLYAHLHNQPAPSAPSFTNEPFAAFVTWKLGNRLRGCIGNFNPARLHDILRSLALKSAIYDRRFPPIAKDELNKLTVSISLLKDFEDCTNWKDWEIGEHGVEMTYVDEIGNHYSSTFLPEVAKEQNWDHRDTILELLRKANYKHVIDEEVFSKIRLKRYSSEKISASYQAYKSNANPILSIIN